MALRLASGHFAIAVASTHVVLKDRNLPFWMADVDLHDSFVHSVVDLDGEDCLAHDPRVPPSPFLLFRSHRKLEEAILEHVTIASGPPGIIGGERTSFYLPLLSTLVRQKQFRIIQNVLKISINVAMAYFEGVEAFSSIRVLGPSDLGPHPCAELRVLRSVARWPVRAARKNALVSPELVIL